jgi:hypothetical protein
MERSDIVGQFPFDVQSRDRLLFRNRAELHKSLPQSLEAQLHRFNLI